MYPLMTPINRALEKLLILMMASIVVAVSWQVFSRFILRSPSAITEELARFLLIWIGILGAAYAYKTRAHLGLDLFIEKLSNKSQRAVRTFIELAVIIFSGCILIYGGISLVSITLELKQISAAMGIQMGYVYCVIPLAGILICLYALDNIIKLFPSPPNSSLPPSSQSKEQV